MYIINIAYCHDCVNGYGARSAAESHRRHSQARTWSIDREGGRRGGYHQFGVEDTLNLADERIFSIANKKAQNFKQEIVFEYTPKIVDKTGRG